MPPEPPKPSEDPTPIVSTGLVGNSKPAHAPLADSSAHVVDWDRLATSARFRELLKAKQRFIVPAVVFFVIYYFALPVLVGYAQPLMTKRVIGPVNLAYLFALSQFFMAWLVAALYLRAAAKFDRMAADVIAGEPR